MRWQGTATQAFTAADYKAVASGAPQSISQARTLPTTGYGTTIPVPSGPTEREERARWEQAADHWPKA